jgi:hypothetical protein
MLQLACRELYHYTGVQDVRQNPHLAVSASGTSSDGSPEASLRNSAAADAFTQPTGKRGRVGLKARFGFGPSAEAAEQAAQEAEAAKRDICGIGFGMGGQLAVLYGDGGAATLLLRPHACSARSTKVPLVPCAMAQLAPQQMIASGAELAAVWIIMRLCGTLVKRLKWL